VYVVALTDDVASTAAALTAAPLAWSAMEHLLAVRPELQMDRADVDADELAKRLRSFWLPDGGRAVHRLGRSATAHARAPVLCRLPARGVSAERAHAMQHWVVSSLLKPPHDLIAG
jgi:hypothetical protein